MGLEIIHSNPEYKTVYHESRHSAGTEELLHLPGRNADFSGAQYKTFVDQAVEKLRSAGDLFNKRLDFRVDEATRRIVVKVIDTRTDKVIKEIPPEQLLHLAAKIQEMVGLLVDEER
jgi:uncharacterized FlaG/YvyC family protein